MMMIITRRAVRLLNRPLCAAMRLSRLFLFCLRCIGFSIFLSRSVLSIVRVVLVLRLIFG